MITFKEIAIKNFWSFGNSWTTINLDQKQTLLIVGENRDKGDHGVSKNGCGKTAVFQAIVWSLFGEGLDRIKQDDFINFTNKKKMECRLTFEVNGSTYQIIRGRKPNKVEVYHDGHEYTRGAARDTDDQIQEIIGTNYDIFINTYLLYPHTDPFMNMKGVEQRSFMEELLALNLLTRRAESLKSKQKDNATDIQLEQQRVETAAKNNERIRQSIADAMSRAETWNRDRTTTIEDKKSEKKDFQDYLENRAEEDRKQYEKKSALQKQEEESIVRIEELNTAIDDIEPDLRRAENLIEQIDDLPNEQDIRQRYEKRAEELQEKLNNFVQVDYEQLIEIAKSFQEASEELKQLTNDIDRIDKDCKQKESQKEKLDREIEQIKDGTCPYCNQPWHNDDHLEELTNQQQELVTEIEQKSQKLRESQEDKEALKEYMGELSESFDAAKTGLDVSIEDRNCTQELQKIRGSHDLIKQDKDQLEQAEKSEQEQNKERFETLITRLKETLNTNTQEECLDRCEELYEKIEDLTEKRKQEQETKQDLRRQIDELQNQFDSGELLTPQAIDQLRRNLEKMDDEIKSLQEEHNPHSEEAERLQQMMEDEDEKQYYELKKIDDHYKMLIKLLTDNKSFVRKNIINQYVPYINRQLNMYLSRLDSQHIAEINPDLDVDLFYMDQSVSYGNLSRGERLRLNLATSLAFRDLNGMLGKPSNLLMIDEYLDSALDPAGFSQVFHLLLNYADHTMIISHREDLIGKADKIMKVIKHNGFTELEYQ